jgi:archaemetzincin
LKRHKANLASLEKLHTKQGKPAAGDWLAEHKESGQTFERYRTSSPRTPTEQRGVMYIQPLGDFTESQQRIVDLTAEFMGIYFGVPVKVTDGMPLSLIPKEARRKHPSWGMDQILSTYVLDAVLKPALPKDACAYLALTAQDLWPGEGWNFVFGQASLRDRVGVWSMYRNGDAAKSDREFRLCLLRTLKTATHETGHMLSIPHCTAWACNMNGSNHQEESDRNPIWLCPECVAKIWWGNPKLSEKADAPAERYEALAAFMKKTGLTKEAAFYSRSAAALE